MCGGSAWGILGNPAGWRPSASQNPGPALPPLLGPRVVILDNSDPITVHLPEGELNCTVAFARAVLTPAELARGQRRPGVRQSQQPRRKKGLQRCGCVYTSSFVLVCFDHDGGQYRADFTGLRNPVT